LKEDHPIVEKRVLKHNLKWWLISLALLDVTVSELDFFPEIFLIKKSRTIEGDQKDFCAFLTVKNSAKMVA
jgi:hypothetical protein